jgi:hypothetical protein
MSAYDPPQFPGFDLDQRPATYFAARDVEFSSIAGQARRRLVRELVAAGKDVPSELAAPTLSVDDREALGRIHPLFMGGEYLPPLQDDEVEIARISLASTTFDQISVRARRTATGIVYSIRDEYEQGRDEPAWDCGAQRSFEPLSMCELIAMLDNACPDGGAVLSPLSICVDGDREQYRDFVTVESDFYPELGYYYAARVDDWIGAE